MARSSERRALRPYEHLEDVQEAFDRITLSVGNEEPYEEGSSVRLSVSSFANEHIYVNLAADSSAFAQLAEILLDTAGKLGIPPSQLELLAVTSGPFTRRSDVIWSFPLSEIKESDSSQRVIAPTHPRWSSTLNPGKGFFLDIYCVLSQDIKRRPLRPSRKGTWLAHAAFKISTDQDTRSFEILALTDDVRERHDLVGKNVVRYLHIDTNPVQPDSQESDIICYVDQDILNKLVAHENSEGADLLQRQLFLDIVGALVTRSSVELNKNQLSLAEIEDSVLYRAITVLTDDEADQQTYLQMVTDEPSKFVAHIEDTLSQPGSRRFTEQVEDLVEGGQR